jgi:hypothetical protein
MEQLHPDMCLPEPRAGLVKHLCSKVQHKANFAILRRPLYIPTLISWIFEIYCMCSLPIGLDHIDNLV